MKNKDLIAKLQELPEDMEVCIFDYKKNIFHADEDGSGRGIYSKIEVASMIEEEIPKETKPWISLSFTNDDYTKDCVPDVNSEYTDYVIKKACE